MKKTINAIDELLETLGTVLVFQLGIMKMLKIIVMN